jgi:hypothetical protein
MNVFRQPAWVNAEVAPVLVTLPRAARTRLLP